MSSTTAPRTHYGSILFVTGKGVEAVRLTDDEIRQTYTTLMSQREHGVGETCIAWDFGALSPYKFNKMEIQNAARHMRKNRREGKISMPAELNLTKVIDGKTWHVLVIHSCGPGLVNHIDPMALFVFDMRIDGLMFAFDQKINRDRVYRFVMGLP